MLSASVLSASAPIDRVPLDLLWPDAPLQEALAGNPDDILEFGPMRIRRHLVHTIIKAGQATATDPILLMAIADKESELLDRGQGQDLLGDRTLPVHRGDLAQDRARLRRQARTREGGESDQLGR